MARRPGALAYLDSSALVKLIIREAETDPLRAALGGWPERRSSALALVEVTRVALLHPEPVQAAARRLLTELRLYEVDPVLADAAAIGTGSSARSTPSTSPPRCASALSLGCSSPTTAACERRRSASRFR